MARPAAQALQSAQQQANLQGYNDRFSSQRQVQDAMERLQPRGPLPPAPSLDPGGDSDLWRDSPMEVKGPSEAEQLVPKLQGLEANIDREAYEANPPAPDWDTL